MEVFSGERIGDYADLIRDIDVIIERLPRLKLACIPKQIAIVRILDNLLFIHARSSLNGFSIAYRSIKFRHFEFLRLTADVISRLFQSNSRIHPSQSTGDTSLNEILLLVEVNVKLIKPSNLTALGGANGIVSQVDKDAQQLMLMSLVINADLTLKLLGSVEIAHIQSRGQISLGVIDTAAIHITGQQHHIDQMRRTEEVGGASALILLAGIQSGGNDCLSIDVVLAEAHISLAALELCAGLLDVHIIVNGVKIVVVPNRANMILRNLHLIVGLTAVTNHDRSGNFLVQILPHSSILVLDHIEIGDIDDVVTVQGVSAVNGLRIGGTSDNTHIAGANLALALLIAVSTDIILAGVDLTGTDTADGALMNLLHNYSDPALVTGNTLRGAGTQILEIREQALNIVNTMLELILLSIDLHSGAQAAHALALGQIEDVHSIRMAQDIIPSILILKHIVLHGLVSSLVVFGFVFGVFFIVVIPIGVKPFHRGADQCVQNSPLLLGHTVNHVLDGLFALGILLFLVVLRLIILGLMNQRRLVRSGEERDRLIGRQNHFLLSAFAMSHIHEFDESARVCAGDDETDLTDNAVHNILVGCLLQPVGIDRQGCDVPVLHQQLGCLTTLRIIEGTIGINAVLAILQKCVAKNVGGFVVLVVPNQGNRLPITILECVMADRPSISADKIVSGSPATKVILRVHFELFPPSGVIGGLSPSPFGALRLLFLSSSALGSFDGFMPIFCRISLEVMISFRVILSAISAMSLMGTSLNGSRKNRIDCFCDRAVLVRNFLLISSTMADRMGSIVRLS
nr:MAG TPA: hypothetical protein [Caudoviricetes sp.]